MRKRPTPRESETEVKAVFEDLNYKELKRRANSPLSPRVAAILEARQVRARYDTAKDLSNAIQGKRTKKKRVGKAVR